MMVSNETLLEMLEQEIVLVNNALNQMRVALDSLKTLEADLLLIRRAFEVNFEAKADRRTNAPQT